ncbi:MAG: CYTH domain-containing protein [Crocinitomicaceae bacterium]|nr:CYTH domain-containing protein [Crocinitomicaceae bacterium]
MKEIERKFLVKEEEFAKLNLTRGEDILQGYLKNTPVLTIRIRATKNHAFITVKGKTTGISRDEFEYEIPQKDALELFDKYISQKIKKKRYSIVFENKKWEIDVFSENLSGLIIAEVELNSESEQVVVPSWCIREVSTDTRYFNAELIKQDDTSGLL